MSTNTDWLMFRDEATIKEWEETTAAMLQAVLHFSEPFTLKLSLPSEAAATEAWNINASLKGSVTITFPGGHAVVMKCFLPFDGVFLSRRDSLSPSRGDDDFHPMSIVWSSWLCEAPGVRIVNPASKKMRELKKKEIRIGLPSGNFIRAELGMDKYKDLKKKKIGFGCFDAEQPKYNQFDWLTSLKPDDTWETACQRANKYLDTNNESDQDDLEHRILMTFPIWLKYRVCKVMLAALPKTILMGIYNEDSQKKHEKEIIDALKKVDPERLGDRLVPLDVKPDYKDEDDGFVYVEPNNPVDLAARLTRVKRLQMSRHAMEEIPAEFRQNHPSFMGRLCPVESPESELVGLSLQLAQGAKVDKDGFILAADDKESAIIGYRANLGWGAGLIPLFQHNDGTRNMMGAKNLRQVLPPMAYVIKPNGDKEPNREAPAIKSGGETALLKLMERLTRTGICPDAQDEKGEMALGRDLLVAYMPWYGWNMEDAIVIGSHVVKNQWFDVAVTKRVKKHIRPSWHPEGEFKNGIDISTALGNTPSAAQPSMKDEGLAKKGSTLQTGDVIARFVSSMVPQPNVIRYTDSSPAVLTEIHFGRPQGQEWMIGTLEYVLEKHIPLRLGDKLMGRHGNKGVIGRIEDTDKMPRLPNDECLPKAFRNRPVDIILNPHGVISRMNIGQLLETHLGWLAHAGGYPMSALMVEGCKAVEIGIPQEDVINHDKVQNALEKTGLDRLGRIQLVLPNGEKTKSPVVVGFEHIVRLKHIPELKSQARGGGGSYDSKTGQAVHGRVRGGGQRAGEMEVWALAGHQANYNLAEMLGGKADAVWARDWQPGNDSEETQEGFSRMMKDWLFAVGIDMSRDEEGKIRFALCTDGQAIRKRIENDGKSHEITSGEGIVKVQTASFACHRENKKCKCGYEFPLDGLCVSKSKGNQGNLRVGDVLTRLECKIAKSSNDKNGDKAIPLLTPISGSENEYIAELVLLKNGKTSGQIHIVFDDFKNGSDCLKCRIRPANGKNRPSNWPQELNEIVCFGRFPSTVSERENGIAPKKEDIKTVTNIYAKYLKEWSISGMGRHTIVDFFVSCPVHTSIPLSPIPPYGEEILAEPGCLFDEQIFGSLKKIIVPAEEEQWGYIKLPFTVKFPLQVFIREKEAWSRMSEDKKDEAIEKFLADEKVNMGANCELDTIPVLPSRYRLPITGSECQVDDPLVADGYRPLLEACQAYQSLDKEADKKNAENRIQQAVENLFFLLADKLNGKFGILRRNGLGRRVDRSSRLVITPNPQLRWNEAAIPPSVLWELMGDQVQNWMKENESEGQEKQEKTSSGQIELLEGWSWLRSDKEAKVLDIIAHNLREYLAAHPDTLILLNRQPSLHKDSFQAFHPVVLNPDDGEVFQLSPLCCKGLGADFDGDEMVGHYPVSEAAQKEAARMLPDNNLLSSATGSSLAHFDQDFVMGSYWLSEFPDLLQKLMELLPGDCCHQKQFVLKQGMRNKKNAGEELLNHICMVHPDKAIYVISEWLRLSLEACSRMGVSFGFYDLLDLTKKVEPKLKAIPFKKIKEAFKAEEDPNELVQDAIMDAVNSILAAPQLNESGLHVAGMAVSGARGKKQLRQLIGARGFLSPGTLGYDLTENVSEKFWFSVPLTNGMKWDTAFYAAMNARSSMCDKKLGTGHAGALTRKLVFALWPFSIVENDCGSKASRRSVLTCRANGGFCAKCYGTLPNGELPHIGCPAGLIAAQSIGERGTQLSMQSFHTGTRAFDIKTVRQILSGKVDYFNGTENASDFVRKFKETDAYSGLDDRHFELLWRVLFDNERHSLDGKKDGKNGVIDGHDIITRLSYSKQAINLLLSALKGEEVEISESPIAKVLFNFFASKKA